MPPSPIQFDTHIARVGGDRVSSAVTTTRKPNPPIANDIQKFSQGFRVLNIQGNPVIVLQSYRTTQSTIKNQLTSTISKSTSKHNGCKL